MLTPDSILSSRSRALCVGLLITAVVGLGVASPSIAQDWGGEDDDWAVTSEPSPSNGLGSAAPGWSLRAGLGFTADPDTFLLNFEVPYAFDRWVSVGPMFQIGFDKHDTIIAPTLNVTVTIPDLPGEDLVGLQDLASSEPSWLLVSIWGMKRSLKSNLPYNFHRTQRDYPMRLHIVAWRQ